MGLGDVSATSVPKLCLVAAPAAGGTICTRTFIPVRVHESIGVLGAVSVATALLLPGAAGADLAALTPGQTRFDIEHPAGHLRVEVEVDTTSTPPRVIRSGVVRTARRLFDGTVFPRRFTSQVPSASIDCHSLTSSGGANASRSRSAGNRRQRSYRKPSARVQGKIKSTARAESSSFSHRGHAGHGACTTARSE
jgi:PrpF protein